MKTRTKNLMYARNVLVVVLVSAFLGGMIALIRRDGAFFGAFMSGASVGFFISLLCSISHFLFLRRLKHFPFAFFLIISTVSYTVIALAVLAIRTILAGDIHQDMTVWTHDLTTSVLATFGITFTVAFVLMLVRMLGPSELMSFFTGRYHRPVEEERIFMFLDLVSSTTIAEKIGHKKFHMFLNDFFYDITDAILSAKGRIYKYVGDEVIISWKSADRAKNGRCIGLYFDIKKIVEEKKDAYIRKFGYVPNFRAGIHCGPVVVGEMGDVKQEISFLGDTVNTTSRIINACSSLGTDLLVSKELFDRIDLPKDYKIKSFGDIALKGKEKPVELFGLERG